MMKVLPIVALFLTGALASGEPREFKTEFRWGDGAKRSKPYVTSGPYELRWHSKLEQYQTDKIAIQIFDDATGSKVFAVIGRLENGKVHVPHGGRHRLMAFFAGENLTCQVEEAPAPAKPEPRELPPALAALAKRSAELKAEIAKHNKELKNAPAEAKERLAKRSAELKAAEEKLVAESNAAAKAEAGTLILDRAESEALTELYRDAIDVRLGGLPPGVQKSKQKEVALPPGMERK